MASHLAETLKFLGTKRRPKPAPTLGDILAEYDGRDQAGRDGVGAAVPEAPPAGEEPAPEPSRADAGEEGGP